MGSDKNKGERDRTDRRAKKRRNKRSRCCVCDTVIQVPGETFRQTGMCSPCATGEASSYKEDL